MPNQAHFFLDTELFHGKNKNAILDQIQGELTTASLSVSFSKSRPHHSLYQAAKLVATNRRYKEDQSPIVVIGNEASMNAVLNAFLTANPSKRRPLLAIDPDVKHRSVHELIHIIVSSLAKMTIQERPLAAISGEVPNVGTLYFFDTLQVGPDFSALLPDFQQKVIWKKAWEQLLSFWGYLSRSQDRIFFSWTLRQGTDYQHNAKTLGLQIRLVDLPGQSPFMVRMVNQAAFPKILWTYLQGKKGRQNPSRRGFITFPLAEQADFHIRDLQSPKLDGSLLKAGAYSFTLKMGGSYPLIQATTNHQKKNEKKN